MEQATKSDRTKQVQFRMPTALHNQLRKLLIDENISMADLFNKAADTVLFNIIYRTGLFRQGVTAFLPVRRF